MRRVFAALALIATVPSAAMAADGNGASGFRAMSDTELRQHLDALRLDRMRDACGWEVPLVDEVKRRFGEKIKLGKFDPLVRSLCAMQRGDDAGALRLLKEAEQSYNASGTEPYGLYLAVRLQDADEALARLQQAAGSGAFDRIDIELGSGAIRLVTGSGHQGELDAVAYDVATGTHFQAVSPDLQSWFASAAIRHASKTGRPTRLDDLLGYIRSPSEYVTMLAFREYEPAWPAIERRAGDNLAPVGDEYVDWAATRLADKPEDRDRLSEYARALLYAGRYDEVAKLAHEWQQGRENLDQGDGWAMNMEAYALDALGRPAEADKVFDRLAALPADEHPWVVNFVINRASRLVGQERWEEGFAATDIARAVAEKHGSTYAMMLVARDRACALQHLGRAVQAKGEIDYLVENFDKAGDVAATGLLCLGREEQAVRLVARALDDETARASVLDNLQDPRFELFYTPSKLPTVSELILSHDALREAALAHARLLPDRFIPLASLRRAQAAGGTGAR